MVSPRPPGLELAGRHGLDGHKVVVEAAGAGEAGGVGGVQDAVGGGEQFLGVLHGQELEKALGADAGPALEDPLEDGMG